MAVCGLPQSVIIIRYVNITRPIIQENLAQGPNERPLGRSDSMLVST